MRKCIHGIPKNEQCEKCVLNEMEEKRELEYQSTHSEEQIYDGERPEE